MPWGSKWEKKHNPNLKGPHIITVTWVMEKTSLICHLVWDCQRSSRGTGSIPDWSVRRRCKRIFAFAGLHILRKCHMQMDTSFERWPFAFAGLHILICSLQQHIHNLTHSTSLQQQLGPHSQHSELSKTPYMEVTVRWNKVGCQKTPQSNSRVIIKKSSSQSEVQNVNDGQGTGLHYQKQPQSWLHRTLYNIQNKQQTWILYDVSYIVIGSDHWRWLTSKTISMIHLNWRYVIHKHQ